MMHENERDRKQWWTLCLGCSESIFYPQPTGGSRLLRLLLLYSINLTKQCHMTKYPEFIKMDDRSQLLWRGCHEQGHFDHSYNSADSYCSWHAISMICYDIWSILPAIYISLIIAGFFTHFILWSLCHYLGCYEILTFTASFLK